MNVDITSPHFQVNHPIQMTSKKIVKAPATTGVLLNGQSGYHQEHEIIDGTLSAREAFTRANALFTVDKAPLLFRNPVTGETQDSDQRCAVYRTDTGEQLGTVGLNYECIQNEQLCQLAEYLRDDLIMDTVITLKGGAKVAFTGKIVGTDEEIVDGDRVHRNLVGYLSHDGTTGFGCCFTDVRVVCQNTLGWALNGAKKDGKIKQISHTKIGVSMYDNLLQSIDVARQTFKEDTNDYRRMQETPMEFDAYKAWLTHLYNCKPTLAEDGSVIDADIANNKVKFNRLAHAWVGGYGTGIEGVSGTAWGAYNAVTEVETSLRDSSDSRNFMTPNGYYTRKVVQKAKDSILELCTA